MTGQSIFGARAWAARIAGVGLLAGHLLLTPSPAHAQAFEDLDAIVEQLMEEHSVPGLSLSVVRDGRVELVRGYGLADVGAGRAVDAETTLFRLASVAKLFVATIVVELAEAGRLDLHRDVREYVPELPVDPDFDEPITLHHLLTHTAGLDERLIGYAAPSLEEMRPLGEYLTSNFPRRGWPPGQVVGYSNHGMALAAYIAERVTGLPFDQLAKTSLFDRLGMTATSYIEPIGADVAVGHACGEGVDSCVEAPVLHSNAYPVGLAYSTARDMGRFILAMLGASEEEAGVLQASALARLHAEKFTHAPGLSGISYAFFNQPAGDQRALSHGGTAGGFDTLLLFVPDAGVGFFFAINGGRSDLGEQLRDALLSRLLGDAAMSEPAGDPPPRTDPPELDRFAGAYLITRYAHHTIERLPFLFGMSSPVFVADGGLWIDDAIYTQVAPLRFRRTDGRQEVAFVEDARGRITHMYAPVSVFGSEMAGAYERLPWYDAPNFKNEYLSFLMGIPLLVLLLLWPLTTAVLAWRRRRRGVEKPAGRGGARVAYLAAVLFSLAFAVFSFGVVAQSLRMLAGATGIMFGMTTGFRLMLLVPWVTGALALAVLVGTVLAWRHAYWSAMHRFYYATVACCAVLAMVTMVRWNYLPPVW